MSGLFATALSFMLVFWAAPAWADVDDFSFDSFSGTYELGRDVAGNATLNVTESLVAQFPDFDQNRGIARMLPNTYNNVPLHTEVLGVTDGQRDRSFTVNETGAFVEIESVVPEGSFVRGSQRYDISYTQRNVVAEFPDSTHQEFYWDLNGTGWPQQFGTVSGEVVVPASLSASLVTDRYACFAGAYGSTTRCDIDRKVGPAGEVRFQVSVSDVQPFETVTVAIAFEPGTFEIASVPSSQQWFIWMTVVAVLAFALMITSILLMRGRLLRSEPGRPTIVAEYLPPKNLPLSSAAHLLNNMVKLPPALLIDLAVSGAVRLQQGDSRKSWNILRTDQPLSPAQSAALTAIAGSVPPPGGTVSLPTRRSSAASQRFTHFAKQATDSSATQRLYKQHIGPLPTLAKIVFTVIGALVAWGSINGETGILWFAPLAAPWWLLIALIALGMLTALLPWLMLSKKPLTALGAETRDHLKGLKMYLELAEKDRLAYLQSPQGAEREVIQGQHPKEVLKLYEQLLPWAILLGVDKQWLKVLQSFYDDTNTPQWINTRMPINIAAATAALTQQTMSSFQSSSTSGTGGSGFAGGGGGGGGGGGR